MASNQFLLLSLCMIVIGASIRVGINQFQANDIEQNRNGLMSSIQTIAADAIVYRTKTGNLGGGKASYVGYTIPKKLSSNDVGTYSVANTAAKITITATSGSGYGTIAAAFDQYGKYVKSSIAYTGNFK